MNCNTPFHKFWKNLDVDVFIPLLIGLICFTGILYVYAFNVEYRQLYETSTIIKYTEYEKDNPCDKGHKHQQTYVSLKYTVDSNPNIIHTFTAPKQNCKNIILNIDSETHNKLYKYKVYNDYVGIFFTGNNSSKRMDNDLYIIK